MITATSSEETDNVRMISLLAIRGEDVSSLLFKGGLAKVGIEPL